MAARLQSREPLRLWLKINRVSSDWTARGSGDEVGREAAMLAQPELAGVWDAFACQYRAFAIEGDVYGLLMVHLKNELFTADTAFVASDEDTLLGAMAALHARYWNSNTLELPWLQNTWHRMFLLSPHDNVAAVERARLGERGWTDVLPLLPRSVAELLTLPTEALTERCDGLPRTLFHGDLKAQNVAVLPRGRAAAVDWGLVGVGPPRSTSAGTSS